MAGARNTLKILRVLGGDDSFCLVTLEWVPRLRAFGKPTKLQSLLLLLLLLVLTLSADLSSDKSLRPSMQGYFSKCL
ncbi:uncharacterized protein LAJ45_09516 [Morchella importuna]|uniref:uncharacterized protein n=1 Tax=Morchella importuna TaxID=1174673 RepID=UPI001E8EBA4C|nr:uncharacterized protein LAJ45_09516 [Morchella importuna]KAH8146568.1 hypothetical protein LAJ45_09516 [Morchella importuna]